MKAHFKITDQTSATPENRLESLLNSDSRYRMDQAPITSWLARLISGIADKSRNGIEEIVFDTENKRLCAFYRHAERLSKTQKKTMDLSTMEIGIGPALRMKLAFSGCYTIAQILAKGEKKLKAHRGMGKKYFGELMNTLESLGVKHHLKP